MGWPTRLVARARAYGRDRVPPTGGLVYAINHMHWLDIPLVGVALAAQHRLRREGRGGRVPGLGRYLRLARHDRGPPRRVRPRRGAPHARVGARRPRRRPLRRGHAAERRGRPGAAQPGAAMVALQEDVPVVPDRDLRHAVLEAGNFAPVLGRVRRAGRASTGCRRAAAATRRRPSRSSAASTCSSTGSPTCTRRAGRQDATPPL